MPQRLADGVATVLLGILGDGTGVEHEQIRRLSEWNDVVTLAAQQIAQHGGLSPDEAKAYVAALSKAKRYMRDVY